ncbi:MAG: hypothetical protein GY745_02710 [Actinomycetia bacterium]|nr:hypothetical protein [Actinomycetes bacterium]MCP3913628.1 hypothetical protein [Actinomycetes bacterium]MCP4083959.1 hypothetical protein [Actinomycetes bacterium]
MGIRLDKPWTDLTPSTIKALPAQLGVYEIADPEGNTTVIGYAGGRELFGIQTALERELATADGQARRFRLEFNHNYMSRYDELLMIYLAERGELPPANQAETDRVGRLNPT